MKTLVMIFAGVSVAGGLGLYLAQRKSPSSPTPVALSDHAFEPIGSAPPALVPARSEPGAQPGSEVGEKTRRAAPVANADGPATAAARPASLPYQQAFNTLISAQAGFEQKQAAWKHLRDSGKLDQAITELEQRAQSEPNVADYPAVLGQACLQKAGTLNNISEQGILGLKADQSFDAALNLDPWNWEAGFWKAAAMSYWPPQLGKGQEVIERFVELVELQEAQPAQPQFAQTYLLLGDQYQKQGYADYTRRIWERGATLFPNDPALAQKLNQPPPVAEQAAVR